MGDNCLSGSKINRFNPEFPPCCGSQVPARKRLEMRTKWKEDTESGRSGQKKIFFADEELFGIGVSENY